MGNSRPFSLCKPFLSRPDFSKIFHNPFSFMDIFYKLCYAVIEYSIFCARKVTNENISPKKLRRTDARRLPLFVFY